VKSIGLGYTFIDVGFWYSLLIPVEKPEQSESELAGISIMPCVTYEIYGTGDMKTAIAHKADIGKFVAEIISDERTLNQYVFCWGDEKSQNELWEIARRVRAEQGGTLNVSPKEPTTKARLEEDLKSSNVMISFVAEYMHSLFVRGDNTVANAKKANYGGALDARELYPDFKVTSIEDFTRELYSE